MPTSGLHRGLSGRSGSVNHGKNGQNFAGHPWGLPQPCHAPWGECASWAARRAVGSCPGSAPCDFAARRVLPSSCAIQHLAWGASDPMAQCRRPSPRSDPGAAPPAAPRFSGATPRLLASCRLGAPRSGAAPRSRHSALGRATLPRRHAPPLRSSPQSGSLDLTGGASPRAGGLVRPCGRTRRFCRFLAILPTVYAVSGRADRRLTLPTWANASGRTLRGHSRAIRPRKPWEKWPEIGNGRLLFGKSRGRAPLCCGTRLPSPPPRSRPLASRRPAS